VANTVNDSILVVEGDIVMVLVASSVTLGLGVKEELMHVVEEKVELTVLVALAV